MLRDSYPHPERYRPLFLSLPFPDAISSALERAAGFTDRLVPEQRENRR